MCDFAFVVVLLSFQGRRGVCFAFAIDLRLLITVFSRMRLSITLFVVAITLAVAQRVRFPAPDFRQAGALMPDGSFSNLSLSDLIENKHWALLIFYPADFTFVCPTELLAFSDAHAEFEQRKVNTVFISVDSKHSHLAWTKIAREEGGIAGFKLPIIGDVTKEICQEYGVVVDDDCEDRGLALRGTFLIDPDGILRHMAVNDLPVGRSVNEAIRLIDAFQFARSNPDQGCPANWKPGKANIKTDPVGSKEYFKEL